MNAEMKEAINAIAADKGMRPEVLYAVLADALESAYKKMPNAHEYAWAVSYTHLTLPTNREV